ncbi:MAG: ABC transporter substrate-binding protein [Lentisphaeraceae bacterium]|nr:ABC transporter substrate-binding protein [Lentisphaeraceae bacterium]
MNFKILAAVFMLSLLSSGAAERKIITLGSAVTEIMYELGFGSELVARDYGSTFPAQTEKLPSLGADHKINVEDVINHKPTHVVVYDRRGTYQGLIKKLKEASVRVTEVQLTNSVEQTKAAVRSIAKEFGVEKKGEDLISKIENDLKKVQGYVKSKKKSHKTIFIYARGVGTQMLAGEKTSAEELIKLAGATPAIAGFSGFKPVNAEKIILANPEAIFLFDSGLESLGGVEGVCSIKSFKFTKAVQEKRIVALDDRSLNLGPRIGLFAMELAKKLHGDIDPVKSVNE